MMKDIAWVSMEDRDKQWHLFSQSILSVGAGRTEVVKKKTPLKWSGEFGFLEESK